MKKNNLLKLPNLYFQFYITDLKRLNHVKKVDLLFYFYTLDF